MSLRKREVLLFFVWLLIILTGPITILKATPISLVLKTPEVVVPFLQRITGLLAFSLFFVQIFIGSFMGKLTSKLGGWVFKFHQTQGAIAYSLILAHPILFVLFNFKLSGVLDPFYVFTEFCVICSKRQELWYTFGRVSFWLVTAAVIAAKFRTSPTLRKHWRKVHLLNYLAFFFIATHAWFSGTDTWHPPFVWLFWASVAAVSTLVIYRIYPYLRDSFSQFRIK